MKKVKIALTALGFIVGIGATAAKSLFPADLYAKNQLGECTVSCASQGIDGCEVNLVGYLTEEDCIMDRNRVQAWKPF